MPVVYSSPSTFGGVVLLSFVVPVGTWTGASWVFSVLASGAHTVNSPVITTNGHSQNLYPPTPAIGPVTNSFAVSANQLLDIQALDAGGTLTASFTSGAIAFPSTMTLSLSLTGTALSGPPGPTGPGSGPLSTTLPRTNRYIPGVGIGQR